MKRLLVALALGTTVGLLALASPAYATNTDEPVCATWQLRGATGDYPDIKWGDSPAGAEVVSASKVKLVKPTSGESPGVEFAAYDLDVTAESDTEVTVKVALSDGATATSGAVRLFGYQAKNADTIHDGPDWSALATGEGLLSFTIPDGKQIGTLGLVYDASNDSAGTVTFSDLEIGKQPVSFMKCVEPSSSPSPSQSVSTKPSGPVSGSVRPSNSSAGTVVVTGNGSLPVTGPGVRSLVAAGAVVLVLGVGALVVASRRRATRFDA